MNFLLIRFYWCIVLTNEFQETKEFLEVFELSEIHSAEEWNNYFEKAVALLACNDYDVRDYAVNRLQNAVWAENSQKYRSAGFEPPAASERLAPIFAAILSIEEPAHFVMTFLRWGSYQDEHKEFLSSWLGSADVGEVLGSDVILACKIMTELYDTDDWNQARLFLEPLFDHQSELVRAAAASALGEMYNNDALNLPSLGEAMRMARDFEIARPGFAGPFIGPLLLNGLDQGQLDDSGINLSDWILEIIARRSGPEPELPFYNGIDFYAHEHLSTDSKSVAKLIELGAEETAAMAATEEDFVVEGMQPLLEQLSFSKNDFVARICAWHLAYHYRVLPKTAIDRGFVSLVQKDDVEIFYVYDRQSHGDRPYAATVYPIGQDLDDGSAWTWVDKLVPPAVRPPMEDNDFPYKTPQIYPGRAVYVYGPYFIKFYGAGESSRWQKIWVKWPLHI